ncbi:YdeI/OmpD-associated family protein [Sunxiuqinia elliptica]|uniref:Uncharacterized conserved protein YdeI, YjbR/CyaY-like superfamily, DUF1801 family n=1 Tax=Sunxiuqinia elliptica TaxID=655355 RepID=A0A1I2HFH8_9BACT|nr:YdeI/OmpD-associated family protein [Sunxiuqinia elliptica]SFF28379.1 Uncharacterized conserved protein YdeI, YjbR/CyaY-like superfamily, DUF1801 family [Sunxiuqinia elliptica]
MKSEETLLFFESQEEFREWLKNNYTSVSELLVGFYKVKSGKKSMTWSESVDQALCFGWIDGIRKSIDQESYCIRFTPRRPDSVWSNVNIQKVDQLTKLGLMRPAGLAAFQRRKKDQSGIYGNEQQKEAFDQTYLATFKANKKAWDNFMRMPKYYHKVVVRWVMSAKQEQTRKRRLDQLIADSEAGLKIKQMR